MSKKIPAYCLHKASGQACVKLGDLRCYQGKRGSTAMVDWPVILIEIAKFTRVSNAAAAAPTVVTSTAVT